MILFKAKFTSYKKLLKQINLTFSVKEDINLLQLEQLLKTNGYLAFNGDPFKKRIEDAMKDTKIGISENGRSYSQIFRGVLFQIAHQNGFDAEDFYSQEMNRIINHYKSKYL